MKAEQLKIAMFSVHSSPIGELGTKDTGGMSVYIRELARELGRRGHHVDIFTHFPKARSNQIIDLYANVRLIHLSIGNNGHIDKQSLYPYLAEYFQMLEKFRAREENQYDLVHSHYWLSGRIGYWAQDYWGVPHILMFHTLGAVKNTLGQGQDEPALRLATERRLAQTCHRILAATDRERAQLMRYYNASPAKIGVVPCGVNLDLFRPADRAQARRRLGLDPAESIVLYVGRFEPLKGIDRLLAAVTRLQHRHRLRLVIVGGDGHQTAESQKLHRLSRNWGIQDAVTFAGRIDQKNLPPYYSAADVLVVPSHYESFGLVALEALACGTPVVATNVGAMVHIIQNGRTGCVIQTAEPGLLAAGIETVLAGTRAGDKSADAIRTSVLGFGWSNVADAINAEYEILMAHQDFPVPRETGCRRVLWAN
ncbi:MAG: glycosyltransferase [Desulfobacterales bacterium]|nr:MAG: glycosyltransferase [Desulfobacterales bacterium]